jgi:hypothetical protein
MHRFMPVDELMDNLDDIPIAMPVRLASMLPRSDPLNGLRLEVLAANGLCSTLEFEARSLPPHSVRDRECERGEPYYLPPPPLTRRRLTSLAQLCNYGVCAGFEELVIPDELFAAARILCLDEEQLRVATGGASVNFWRAGERSRSHSAHALSHCNLGGPAACGALAVRGVLE